MQIKTQLPSRRPNRLKDYDYSQAGCYFITVCTHNRQKWFGTVNNGVMEKNDYGKIITECWQDLPNHYPNVKIDARVVMPNHVHGIIIIGYVGNGLKPFPTQPHGLSEIIRGFKTFSSRCINKSNDKKNKFRWQKSFYDHIIRNEESLNKIREYIINNPETWDSDENNLKN